MTRRTESTCDPKSQRDRPEGKVPSGRQRGAQRGHPGASRELVPEQDVQEIVACLPGVCQHCHTVFAPNVPPDDRAAIREQVWELPPIPWEITEFRRYCRTCPQCAKHTWGSRPPGAPRGCCGFRLQGVIGLLTGGAQLTRRTAQRVLQELFQFPIALGTISAVENTLQQVLAAPYAEVATAVADCPSSNCDESPWRAPGKKPWLWAAVGGPNALFRIDDHRNREAFEALGLNRPGQVKTTDRYTVYIAGIDPELHQLCWSHLDRDFERWEGQTGAAGTVARWLGDSTDTLFHHWHGFHRGEYDRATLVERMEPVQRAIRAALCWGVESKVRRFDGLCANLLDRWPSLWTYLRVEGVEPTNNAAERALRPAVIWRKVSLFTQSERGQAYVERMLTVRTSLRNQAGNLLEFLTGSIRALHTGEPAPRLLQPPP